MTSPIQISARQLQRLVGTPDCPTILDVRIDSDFNDDPFLIPTAIRHSYRAMDELAAVSTDRRIVVYCQKGLKISEGAAAVLRCHGIAAEVLQDGHLGWRNSGLPLIPYSAIPRSSHSGRSVWVTRLRPKIDRIACPWLIRRFVDTQSQFLFVSASQVDGVAERFDACPFDMDSGDWSHDGDRCTFDTMLDKFKLHTEPLDKLAAIVRAADTDQLQSNAEAAGLLAASLGLSRMFSDDLAQLEQGLGLYDMFYRWARDATDERHTWPAQTQRS